MTVAAGTEFIDRIERLPPLSNVVHRIMAMTNSGDATAMDIADVLSEDQAITAKILRVANSSFFGTGRRVTQVSRAVMMLGTIGVRNLVLGVAARDSLKTIAAGDLDLDHTSLWCHSVAVGSACETIARQIGHRPPEEAFVAGLLHDIGQLAMMTIHSEGLEAVVRQQARDAQLLELERGQFGIDHTEAGFRILTRWRIPDAFCQAALRHHEQRVDPGGPNSQLLAIIMLGDTLAQMMGFGLDAPMGRMERAQSAMQVLGFDEAAVIGIVDTLNRRVEQAAEVFDGTGAVPCRELPAPRCAVWISADGGGTRSLGQLLLKQHGYEVVRVSPENVDELPPADLILVALPDEEDSARLALEASHQGRRGVVVLADPPDGGVLRRCDESTGVCRIPRIFTAFDVAWIEEQMK